MKKRIVNPVSSSLEKKAYFTKVLHTPDLLSTALQKKGVKISLGKTLKGGTISQVYESKLNGKPVIVKHTEDLVPFDPTEIFISKEGHNIDSFILNKFQDLGGIRVPRVIHHFSDITTTIMEDVRENGYHLLSAQLELGAITQNSAEKIGKNLAYFIQESRNWKKFKTNESEYESIYERGLELRLSYPNTQTQYLELEKEFTTDTGGYVWSDCHPKNMLVNDNGDVVFIDFGRSHRGDQRFMLPNFLSHIVLYSLLGNYPSDEAVLYMKNCIKSYEEIEEVDEEIFCKYLAMEILHRTNGKWISGVDTVDQKISLQRFGLSVFDKNIVTIEEIYELLHKVNKK